MEPPDTSSRRSGPVLSEATTRAIRAAVYEELARDGYGSLSMEAVARRAAVGKAAIYRRWPSKQEMVISIVAEAGLVADLFPDTGSLEGDLRASLRIAARHLRHPLVSRIVPDLLAETARDSAFGAVVYERIGVARRDRGLAMVRRAVERGELPAVVDHALAADMIAAPLYWRLAITREPFDERDLKRLVAVTLAALLAA